MDLTWKNVLHHHIFIPPYKENKGMGWLADKARYAKDLGYPYFSWNDNIYETESGKYTGHSVDIL